MATVIKAGNVASGAQVTSDATGILQFNTGSGAGTTAMTIGTDQSVTFAGAVSSSGNQTVTGNLTVDGNTTLGNANTDTILMTAAPSIGGAGLGMGFGFRNRIINGNMVIDQRNAGASVTPSTDGQYTLDRWAAFRNQASKYSVQQNAGSVTPPSGFASYLGVTSLSAYSITSGDYFAIGQVVEGFNIADLAWGTANAQSITLSFWVRSSLTGTFGGSVQNGSYNRSYPFSYTVSSANTWEQKSITIPGDTSGTWLTTNGAGIALRFGLGVGSSYSATAGAWAAGSFNSATGATSVVGTNGATFYITGVQLEKGSTATSFDYRDYGRELILCQRYYQRYGVNSTGPVGDSGFLTGAAYTSISYFFPTIIPITMRTGPSVSISGLGDLVILTNGSAISPNAFGISGSGVVSGGSGANRIEFFGTTASAFASGGQAVWLRLGSSGWVALSAEL